MLELPLYTLSAAARELGKKGNRGLLRAMIKHHKIPMYKVGNENILDRKGFGMLKALVEEWDRRPTLRRLQESSRA